MHRHRGQALLFATKIGFAQLHDDVRRRKNKTTLSLQPNHSAGQARESRDINYKQAAGAVQSCQAPYGPVADVNVSLAGNRHQVGPPTP